jgi:glycosyltransferase involved in cell wall biosynthesis
MKVSVLMPVYNTEEKFLREAIESILNQTFVDFEFIIINDGSTNNAKEVILSYSDSRIKYYEQENKGLIVTLNYGLTLCKGQYIARMDSDDISYPDRFQQQIEILDKNPQIGVVGALLRTIPYGELLNYKEKPKYLDILKGCQLGHPVVMIRKSILDKFDLKYENFKHAEDYDLWSRIIKYTQIYNIQDVLLDYRIHPSAVSIKYADIQKTTDRVIKMNMLDFLTDDTKLKNNIMHLIKLDGSKEKVNILKQLFSIENEHKNNKKYKVLTILGIKIKFKIKNLHNSLLQVRKISLSDFQILKELDRLGEFSYIPNSGNMGDMLIASATMQWLDNNSLKWNRLSKGEIPENLVYGGGGAWTKEWINDLSPIMDLMKKCKRVVILPSSFDNVPEFIDILDERFVVFCREEKSFNYLKSQNTEAKILLDHDMALRLLKVPDKSKNINKKLKRKANKLNRKLLNLPKDINLFRLDNESKYKFKSDFDLSDALGWFSCYETRETIDFVAYQMLRSVELFTSIRTDRLHVGIAGILTGKEVKLYDNSYGKVKNVYYNSLRNLPYVEYKEGDLIE